MRHQQPDRRFLSFTHSCAREVEPSMRARDAPNPKCSHNSAAIATSHAQIMLKMLVAAAIFDPLAAQSYLSKTQAQKYLTIIWNGQIIALCVLPANFVLDRLFNMQQRVVNRHEGHGISSEVTLIARQGLLMCMEAAELRSAFMGWIFNLHSMAADEVTGKLLTMRQKRRQSVVEAGAFQKADKELSRLISRTGMAGRVKSGAVPIDLGAIRHTVTDAAASAAHLMTFYAKTPPPCDEVQEGPGVDMNEDEARAIILTAQIQISRIARARAARRRRQELVDIAQKLTSDARAQNPSEIAPTVFPPPTVSSATVVSRVSGRFVIENCLPGESALMGSPRRQTISQLIRTPDGSTKSRVSFGADDLQADPGARRSSAHFSEIDALEVSKKSERVVRICIDTELPEIHPAATPLGITSLDECDFQHMALDERAHKAARVLQNSWRRLQSLRAFRRTIKEVQAAAPLLKLARSWIARRRFAQALQEEAERAASIALQRAWRSHAFRRDNPELRAFMRAPLIEVAESGAKKKAGGLALRPSERRQRKKRLTLSPARVAAKVAPQPIGAGSDSLASTRPKRRAASSLTLQRANTRPFSGSRRTKSVSALDRKVLEDSCTPSLLDVLVVQDGFAQVRAKWLFFEQWKRIVDGDCLREASEVEDPWLGTNAAEQPLRLQQAGEWIPFNRRLRKMPMIKYYFNMCDSPVFWRWFPWMFVIFVNGNGFFFCLLYCNKYFAFNEEVMLAWLQNVATANAIGLFGMHTFIVIAKNNMSWTKKIMKTKRYQIIEKFVVTPLVPLMRTISKQLFG